MIEIPILLKNIKAFLGREYTLVMDLVSPGSFGLFPVGLSYPAGKHRIALRSDGAGNITILHNDDPEPESFLSLFCFVDSAITITCSDEKTIVWESIKVVDLDGKEIEDMVQKYETGIGTSGIALSLPVQQNRSMAKVIARQDGCQISFDFIQESNPRSTFGITLSHAILTDIGHANVFFDRHKDGVWLPESRIKIGYVEIVPNEPYIIHFAVIPEPTSDEWGSTVKVSITVSGKTKIMRETGRVALLPIVSVIARESGSAMGVGAFEVSPVS